MAIVRGKLVLLMGLLGALTLVGSAEAATTPPRMAKTSPGPVISRAQSRSDEASAALANYSTGQATGANPLDRHAVGGTSSATSTSAGEEAHPRGSAISREAFTDGTSVERVMTEDGAGIFQIKDRSGRICYGIAGSTGTSMACL